MYGFAIFLLGITWFSVATLFGATLGDVWTFGHILSIGHMAAGFIIMMLGILRTD